MRFKQALFNVVSNPEFTPPDNFMELDLTSIRTILDSYSREVSVRFAVGEARLVLPIFEDKFPDDSRPRKAIEATETWLRDPSVGGVSGPHAVIWLRSAAVAAAAAARIAADAATKAWIDTATHAADAATYAADPAYKYAATAAAAAYAVNAAALAQPPAGVRIEDQLVRLFNSAESTLQINCI